MHLDFFSGTFYAMRTKYKKKHKLLSTDQADYFFESFFIIAIQVLLCVLIWIYDDKKIQYKNEFGLNLCMFFTNLVMHFSCIATIRNGINMMKFVVYHSDEFANPIMAFSLGLGLVLGNILCASTNVNQSLKQPNVISVISKFVGFKLLIQIQDYYLKSRANFSVSKSVKDDPLIIKAEKTKIKYKSLFFIYKAVRTIYTSIYFYFFPMSVITLPLLQLMLIGNYK